MTTLLQKRRNHPDYLSTRFMDSLSHTFHQSHVTTTIYQGMTFTTHPFTQPTSHGEKIRVDVIIG